MALFVVGATVTAQQPSGMWGWYQSRAIGNEYVAWAGQTGMSGCEPGYVIARGQLTAAEHELEVGTFNLQTLGAEPSATVMLPAGAEALSRARDLSLKDVELVLRPLPQRTLDRVSR